MKTGQIVTPLFCACQLAMLIGLSSCKKDEDAKPIPVVTSFSPTSGVAGSVVTITGQNFAPSITGNVVKFNGIVADVTAATATTITTTVPNGTVTGKITIEVNDMIATSSTEFTVLFQPTISSFDPAYGPEGSSVTITGTHFSSVISENTVKVNGVTASIESASQTELTIEIPAGATTGKIAVTVNGLTATSLDDFQVGCSDVEIINATITEISGSNFNFEYEIKNVGTIPLDLTEMYLQTYVSPDGIFGGPDEVGSGGFSKYGASEPLLLAGEVRSKTAMITAESIDIVTHPYVILQILTFDPPPSAECSTENNELSALIAIDVPRDGLVAFYPFSGSANDESGNDLHGTVTNAVLTADRFGMDNKAYSFDGSGDYISMGNPQALQITNAISIGLWLKNDFFDDGAVMLSKAANTNQSGTEGHGYKMRLSATGNGDEYYTIYIEYPGSGGAGSNFAGAVPFTADEWVFFAFTLEGSNAKFYKNGVEGFSVTNHQPLTAATEGNFEIGRHSGGGFDFTGLIDDVAVYNRALSAEEIMQLFKQTVSKH